MYFGSKAINRAFVTSKTQKQQIGLQQIGHYRLVIYNRLVITTDWSTGKKKVYICFTSYLIIYILND